MNALTKHTRPGRALARTDGERAGNREELCAWMATLRGEVAALRKQADHINRVADDAEAMVERIERVLRGL